MTSSEADIALACMREFVDELVLSGMEDACVSPGSRSTPLALALWRHPAVHVHVHIDERASAFFALGLAKATGHPVAVACTSGTAAANLLPAVVEASMSRVPLILLTADRPPELRGVGANQTIEQPGLFGAFVGWSLDAGVPAGGPYVVDHWRGLASESVRHSEGPPPTPVHVNLPFREPLTPSGRAADIGQGATTFPRDARAEPEAGPQELEGFLAELGPARGVLLAGSLRRPAPSLVELAGRLRWPLASEPTSGLRVTGTLAAGQCLLSNDGFVAGHVPELVVQVGAAPTSRAGLSFVARARRLIIVDPDDLVADPNRVAARRIVMDPDRFARAALARVDETRADAWLADWTEADAVARRAVDETIDEWDEPYEGRIARDLAASLSDGSTLVVGSSMPVRDLDAYMLPREGLGVLANRGASGIDGFVSTTLGVAASGGPTTALCGDLTLLHDVGSLLWSARRGYETVFVVPNNRGGVIFSFLPQRDLPELGELFTTRHGLDLGAICAASGAGHHLVDRADELVRAVERARSAGGVHVVEVTVDPELNVRRHAEVHEAVAASLGRA